MKRTPEIAWETSKIILFDASCYDIYHSFPDPKITSSPNTDNSDNNNSGNNSKTLVELRNAGHVNVHNQTSHQVKSLGV
jgi:hypothetical protein